MAGISADLPVVPPWFFVAWSRAMSLATRPRVRPQPACEPEATDTRFRALLGEADWLRLPSPVRDRFSKRLDADSVALYRGQVVATELSTLGWWLAQAARLIGAPLPTMNGAVGPAVVMVSADAASDGQRWLRIFERPGRTPQMVLSTKRFGGASGLEEEAGGIVMELRLSVEDGALVFRSQRYRLTWRSLSVTLPRWMSPGEMTIVHAQEADGGFSFRLTLEHGVFGQLLHQLAYFHDVKAATHPADNR